MDRHICKHCGKPFNYCGSCVFKKIPYKAAGFCSPECSAAFKASKIKTPEVVEVAPVVIEPIEEEIFIEDEVSTEVEAEVEFDIDFDIDCETEVERDIEVEEGIEVEIEDDEIHE